MLALALLLCAGSTHAAVEGPGRHQFIRSAPARASIHIDGKLDETDWASAPVFDSFVQRFPQAGAVPSERTELRVLYDSNYVYFGIVAHDSRPALIDRRLGRRDSALTTDTVTLILDPTHDHRTGYYFWLSAGGIQGDGLYTEDNTSTADWDGVWDGAVGPVADGWVAEFAIPLMLLRFPAADVQTWGFSVRRKIARLSEEVDSVDNPRTTNATISRLGHLTGMEVKPQKALELVPYIATRGIRRPQFSDESRPHPRLIDPLVDVGLDLKAALSSDLALNATLNPDFGQVEADQLILNLSTYEILFPEKRPFFTQGLELFQPVGLELGKVPQTLFYSRRIGLDTPILGAAKLTGTAAKGVEVGVLDALVTGPWQEQNEEDPDRRWRLHPTRPLHLGPNSSLPGTPQPATNFLAAVARGSLADNSRMGVSLVAATPLVGGCTAEEAALDEEEQPAECLARGGLGAAADFDLMTSSGEYGVLGQVDASRSVGGPPERTLVDGTVLHRWDTGYGGYLRAGKFGGEGLRGSLEYDFSTPTLELNAIGFQRTQNENTPRMVLRYERQNDLGPLKSLSGMLSGSSSWTTDGRGVHRGNKLLANVGVMLPSFDYLMFEGAVNFGGYEIRELDSTGIPLEAERNGYVLLYTETNGSRPVSLSGLVAADFHERGPASSTAIWAFDLTLALRPHPTLETRLQVSRDTSRYGPRFADSLGDNRFLLGNLDSHYLSITLRQQWVIQPRLTLQVYGQLFTAYGVYGQLYEGVSDAKRSPIRFSALTPTEGQADNFYDSALNLNVVLRWEYRLGSTLFLVYTRSQQELPTPDGEVPPATVLPKRLFSGPSTDAVLLKWTWYWSA
ncbi:DUF5916 domain-containing protein [Hyalangium versicolor]|uniref:DUF5916 domain-containing protein n=1 Tax=Hyalangium versicolor TaxID=2861190 RepID=UPI001CC947A8|nr:DUF5916 domain-containing protein [Hyalangium versicolor]